MRKNPQVVRLAEVLDHIVALENGGPDFDTDCGQNRQGLCVECHEVKTREDFGYRTPQRIGVDGYPVEEAQA